MGQKCCTDHFTVVALLLMQGVPRCPQCQGSKLCPRAALHKPEGTQPLSAVCHFSAVPAGCLLPARGSEAKGATLGIFCCLCLGCCRCWGRCSSSPMAGWHRSALPCPAPAAAGSPRVNRSGPLVSRRGAAWVGRMQPLLGLPSHGRENRLCLSPCALSWDQPQCFQH